MMEQGAWTGSVGGTARFPPEGSDPQTAPHQQAAPTDPPPRPAAARETAGDGPAGSRPETAASPTVSPGSIASGPADSPHIQAGAFRISRTPAGGAPLRVHYDLTAYRGTEAVSREGAAVIAPGSAHVCVSAAGSLTGRGGDPEVVTLTLRSDEAYQIGRPAATLFRDRAAGGCSEAALFEAYRRGQSHEAFNALVELHRPAVLRTCSGILGNWADAEDVSQLVFMKLGRMPGPLNTTLTSWLSTVARNASIEFLRSRNRRTRHELRAARAVVTAAEDALLALRDELDAALARLPDSLREAVRLRYLEGLSQKEAAELLGCPRGTLSQRAARGIRCLRTILAGDNVAV
jgi:RNA polymerase sigma-70 factor (ECF subfamily)